MPAQRAAENQRMAKNRFLMNTLKKADILPMLNPTHGQAKKLIQNWAEDCTVRVYLVVDDRTGARWLELVNADNELFGLKASSAKAGQ